MKKILGLLLFAFTIFFVAIWWNKPFLLLATLSILALPLFALSFKKRTFAVFIFAAIAGPIAEIISIHFGAWAYSAPQFFGIPVWLPILWGMAGVSFSKISQIFSK